MASATAAPIFNRSDNIVIVSQLLHSGITDAEFFAGRDAPDSIIRDDECRKDGSPTFSVPKMEAMQLFHMNETSV